MPDYRIKSVHAVQVQSRRHNMAVSARVETMDGAVGKALCYAGVSVGTHEVHFQYDGGNRWGGLGCMSAVRNVNTTIADTILGMDVRNQFEIDQAMLSIQGNGSASVGGNAIAAVSAAVLKAGAAATQMPLYRYIGGENACMLPVPGAPAFSGGERWGGAVHTHGNKPTGAFQCFGYDSFSEASSAAWDMYHLFAKELEKRGVTEGDWFFYRIPAGIFKHSDEELFELMADVIHKTGNDGKAGIQIDVAADCYYDRNHKRYRGLFSKEERDRDQLLAYYLKLIDTYPFVSIEDAFYEDDYESHAILREKSGIQIVGDDLYTTMRERVSKGVETGATNVMLLKVNQVGSISQAFEAARFAHECGMGVMPCESRGEDEDIADYCVGLGTECVREMAILNNGANRFLEIEDELGSKAKFWGKRGLKGRKFQE